MKVVKFMAMALAVLSLSSCAVVGTQVGMGTLYTDVKEGYAVTSNSLGNKVGTAKAVNVLGLVAIGDASIQTAARNAGIKKISHVDTQKNGVLGLFSSNTIIVYGE